MDFRKLKLIRNDDQFTIVAASGQYKILLTELALELRSVEVSAQKLKSILNTWESGKPYIMPFLQSRQKYYSIPKGVQSWSIDNLYTGLLPKQVLILTYLDTLNFHKI